MKEKNILRFSILFYWTFFWGLSVLDKIIPDVHHLWVGKDFFALFVKFFGSLGLKDPIFATIALAFVSSLEGLNFVFYLLASVNFLKEKNLFLRNGFLEPFSHPLPYLVYFRLQIRYLAIDFNYWSMDYFG